MVSSLVRCSGGHAVDDAGPQWTVTVTADELPWAVDAPNILAVPKALLRERRGHLTAEDRLRVEATSDFMLRGC